MVGRSSEVVVLLIHITHRAAGSVGRGAVDDVGRARVSSRRLPGERVCEQSHSGWTGLGTRGRTGRPMATPVAPSSCGWAGWPAGPVGPSGGDVAPMGGREGSGPGGPVPIARLFLVGAGGGEGSSFRPRPGLCRATLPHAVPAPPEPPTKGNPLPSERERGRREGRALPIGGLVRRKASAFSNHGKRPFRRMDGVCVGLRAGSQEGQAGARLSGHRAGGGGGGRGEWSRGA